MPFKDPVKQKEYQREWQRAKRAGEPTKVQSSTLSSTDIQTAQDMLNILTEMLGQLLKANADLFLKARTIAYCISVGLRAVETAEIEARLTELEKRVLSIRDNGHIHAN